MDTSSIALVVVTEQLGSDNAAYGAVQNFIDIYDDEVDSISILGPETIEIDRNSIEQVPIQRKAATGFSSQVMDYIYYQFKIAYELYKRRRKYKAVFFHIGGSMLLLPVLICKLTGLRSIIFITGSTKESYHAKKDMNTTTRLITQSIGIIESITCNLSDDVLLLSESMRSPRIVNWFPTNVSSANFNYIDCSKFEKKTQIADREYDIIFLGRFESVKGVTNIIRSIPLIMDSHPNIKIELIGDGELRNELERIVMREGLSKHVSFTGWVDHNEIPDHLNNGRILLMPSESEGVPKTLLEAMACGTIPIAATVGGVPDIITENENGFLLPNTKPNTIAEVVSQTLQRNDLEQVSDRARDYIEEEYSYDVAKKQYQRILDDNFQ